MTWRGGLDARLLARRRQGVFRGTPPAKVWALIQEEALRRAPGGKRQILLAQLESLKTDAMKRDVKVQILPDDSPAALAAPGAFSMLRFPRDPDLPDVVFLEMLTGITCLERRKDIDRYLHLLEVIAINAHRPDMTTALLDEITAKIGTSGQRSENGGVSDDHRPSGH